MKKEVAYKKKKLEKKNLYIVLCSIIYQDKDMFSVKIFF